MTVTSVSAPPRQDFVCFVHCLIPGVWCERCTKTVKENKTFSFNKHFLITPFVTSFTLGLVWTEIKYKTRVLRRGPQTKEGNKQDTTRDGV